MHIYSTVSISRSSLLQQRKWTTIYVTVLHKLQKKNHWTYLLSIFSSGRSGPTIVTEWCELCASYSDYFYCSCFVLIKFLKHHGVMMWIMHPGGLIQRWKRPSSSSSSLLTNVVMEPEVSSGRIDHVSH